jgi:hypothetical protein
MDDVNISNGDAPTDEVEIDLNMLCVLMLDGVVGEVARDKGCAAPEEADEASTPLPHRCP